MSYICLNRGTAGGKLTVEEFVKLAAEAGFAGADVNIAYGVEHGAAALGDLFARHKMRFGGWPLPDFRSEPAKLPESHEQLKKMAAVAEKLGIDSCGTFLMPSSELPFVENWLFHVSRLQPFAAILAEHGLRLGLEFVAPFHLRRKERHEFIFTPGQMLELADAIGPNAGLLVDSYHCYTAGDTWEHLAQIPANKIVLGHINDAPKGDISQLQDGRRLLPGEGVIDLAGFLKALAQAGYKGPVSVEVLNPISGSSPPRERAIAAWQGVKRALDAAGL